MAEPRSFRTSVPLSVRPGSEAWSLVLAGGEGARLAPYVSSRLGHGAPKQYCTFTGTRSMLEHTLDRATCLVPPARTVTVIGPTHDTLAQPQLQGRSGHVLRMPVSRETGVGLYYPLAFLRRFAPRAVVAIYPADHFIAPEGRFLDRVTEAISVAFRNRDRIVVFGAVPELDPRDDTDYGWLSPGDPVEPGVRRLRRFVEKPDRARARLCRRAGDLWNTMITVASVEALWALADRVRPDMTAVLDKLGPCFGRFDEDAAIGHAFARLPAINWSRDLLEREPERVLVMSLDGVEWSDWGRGERIDAMLSPELAVAAR